MTMTPIFKLSTFRAKKNEDELMFYFLSIEFEISIIVYHRQFESNLLLR